MNKKAIISFIIAAFSIGMAQYLVDTFRWDYFLAEVVIGISVWNIFNIFTRGKDY